MLQDTSHRVYDVDEHNLCSAVVERGSTEIRTFVGDPDPSSIKSLIGHYELVIGDVDNKLIDRGGMQDLHTEVRAINHFDDAGLLVSPNVVTFFSSRSVCGTIGAQVFPIQRDPYTSAPPMNYVNGPTSW